MNDCISYDAFISYASPDLAFAEQAHRRLTAAGFTVWFDKARLDPGCDWHREIEAGCEASRVLLPILTPRWKLSEWTKFEIYGAEAVIPLLVEGPMDEVFTPPLTRFQGETLDFSRPDDAAWKRLFDALRRLLARGAPDKLARLHDVRYPANPYFVGREMELNLIHEQLHQNPTTALTQGQVRAVTAMGGVGKTTLARQYVEKFWRCYPQIFWIDCRLGVEIELARLCDLMFPQQAAATANVVEKARLALRQLQSRDERLLVMDSAEDETSIQAWLPRTGSCRTLITSRFAGWSAGIKAIHLCVLEAEPARTLLATRAGRGDFADLSGAEQAACDELAKRLGYLPLALEQAAAYVEQQGAGFGFADYLRLYEVAERELLEAGVPGSTEYPESVATTWKVTTAKLGPASRGILRLCAFLAPTPLPLDVLLDHVEVLRAEGEAVAGAPLPPAGNAEFWVRQQVRQLRAYSMVQGDGQSLMLHLLVQTVERLNLAAAAGEYRATLERTLRWIDAAFESDPDDVRTWPTLEPLAPHADTVTDHADQANIADPTARLMNSLGLLNFTKARHAEAEVLYRRALAIAEQSFGKDHPHVATGLNNLAVLLRDTNRHAEAEPLHRRGLAIDEQSFGKNHPNVATCLNNLALLLQATNRLAEAEPLYRRALAIDEQSFGKNHPHVVTCLNNLVLLLQATSRHAEAEPLYRRALAVWEQSFGKDHPHVAACLNGLAGLLQATSRLAEAEPLYRRALAIREQSFGKDHPDVAACLDNLAVLLGDTNRHAEAEPLMRRALVIWEQSFGKGHPGVATCLNNLALLLQDTNRLAEAEPLFRRALAIWEQSFGNNHPDVARGLNNLALLLKDTNRMADSESLSRRALAILLIFTRQTGHQHPHLQGFFQNYATLLQGLALNESEIEQRLNSVFAEAAQSLGPITPEDQQLLEPSPLSVPLNQAASPYLDELLGPARSVDEVFAALDAQYRAEGRPPVYFLGLDEPIAPHLDELLGPARSVDEVLAALNSQYRAEGRPPIYFLGLDESIAPHLDELLGPARSVDEVLTALDEHYRAGGSP